MKILKSLFILVSFITAGCGNHSQHIHIEKTDTKNEISRAERFMLKRKTGYTEVTVINPWQGANNINQVYQLVRRGNKLPKEVDSTSVIYVPIRNIICMSTTHIAMISALGEENSITGLSGTGFIYSESLIKKAENGIIKDIGYEANLNKELILKISPDLITMYGIGSESAGYVGKIRELGINILFNADYLETDPLGKAEWIKLYGALYCKEDIADSIYNSEIKLYTAIQSSVSSSISYRPKVLLGLPYKDIWYISPGNSFVSKLIQDAGGEYLWQNTISSISMPYSIENVYLNALTADFWLNIGDVKTKNDISILDKRLEKLPCFKRGNLFNNNNRITLRGGNDYWESATVYPHLILKDLVSIIHPDLLVDNKLFYYRKIN